MREKQWSFYGISIFDIDKPICVCVCVCVCECVCVCVCVCSDVPVVGYGGRKKNLPVA